MISFKKIRFSKDDEEKYSSLDFIQHAIQYCKDVSHVLYIDSYYLPSEVREHFRNLREEVQDLMSSVEKELKQFSITKSRIYE